GFALAAVLAHGALAAPSARPCLTDAKKPPAGSVVACLRKGPVVLEGATIRGLVDFRPLETVGHVFVCRSCAFLGWLDGSDVDFSHPVDLTDSRVVGPLEMDGAVFHGPMLATGLKTRGGPVSFQVAVFDDIAGFDEAVFTRAATFARARFRADVTFAGTA